MRTAAEKTTVKIRTFSFVQCYRKQPYSFTMQIRSNEDNKPWKGGSVGCRATPCVDRAKKSRAAEAIKPTKRLGDFSSSCTHISLLIFFLFEAESTSHRWKYFPAFPSCRQIIFNEQWHASAVSLKGHYPV